MTDLINTKNLYKQWGPRTVQIEITNLCNARCIMCDRWNWDKKKAGNLTSNVMEKLFDDLINTGATEVIFSGGEPFMRPDFIDILALAKKSGLEVSIFTNGSLIT